MEGVELMNRKHCLTFNGNTDRGRENGISEQVIII